MLIDCYRADDRNAAKPESLHHSDSVQPSTNRNEYWSDATSEEEQHPRPSSKHTTSSYVDNQPLGNARHDPAHNDDSHHVPPRLLEEIRNHHIITDKKQSRRPSVPAQENQLGFQKVQYSPL